MMAGIGFVCTIGPPGSGRQAAGGIPARVCPESAIEELALFRTFVPRPPGRVPPGRAGIGFVLRISLSGPPADQPNWVRFERSPLGSSWVGRPRPAPSSGQLASFCTFDAPNWLRLAASPLAGTPSPRYPTLPKFGFVLRHSASRHARTPGNWVRFAQSPLGSSWVGRPRPTPSSGQLASFRTFDAPNWVRFAQIFTTETQRACPRAGGGHGDGSPAISCDKLEIVYAISVSLW